jgi:hypothetical protein
MEPQGAGKQVLQHPGPQVVNLLSEQEMVEIWRWSHVRTRMTLCTCAEDEKERLSWCLGPTVRVSGPVTCVIVPDPNGRIANTWTRNGEENGYEVMCREEARA